MYVHAATHIVVVCIRAFECLFPSRLYLCMFASVPIRMRERMCVYGEDDTWRCIRLVLLMLADEWSCDA